MAQPSRAADRRTRKRACRKAATPHGTNAGVQISGPFFTKACESEFGRAEPEWMRSSARGGQLGDARPERACGCCSAVNELLLDERLMGPPQEDVWRRRRPPACDAMADSGTGIIASHAGGRRQ